MTSYIILTHLAPDAFAEPKDFKKVAEKVSARIKAECPKVLWKHSYATMGRCDFIDIVESDDPQQVRKAVMIIRALGHATTETMVSTPWKEFIESL